MKLFATLMTLSLGVTHAIGSPKKDSTSKCTKARTLKVNLLVTGPFILPNGTIVNSPDTVIGLRLPFAGNAYNAPGGDAVGFNTELCTRLDDNMYWHCEGTLTNLYGCKGNLNFAGPFIDSTSTGDYTIIGGTRDFDGAKGYIAEIVDEVTGYTNRTISLHY